MSGELETVVVSGALADLTGVLRRTIDALTKPQIQGRRPPACSYHLAARLQRLLDMLPKHREHALRHSEDIHPEVLSTLKLCICCSRLLLTYINIWVETVSSNVATSFAARMIAGLRSYYQEWRLARRVTRQVEALQLTVSASMRETPREQTSRLTGRDTQRALARIQHDAASIFGSWNFRSMFERVAAIFERRTRISNDENMFLSRLCAAQFGRINSNVPSYDYLTIHDLRRRSHRLDRILVDEERRRCLKCQMPVFGAVGGRSDVDRLLAELNGLRLIEEEDELARTRSTIEESVFFSGQLRFHLYQLKNRGERRKYFHMLDSSEAFVFMADLASYHFVLEENRIENVLVRSISNFQHLVERSHKGLPIILVLDKVDQFGRQLQKHPLENAFPGYCGSTDLRQALGYVLSEFLKCNKFGTLIKPIFASYNEGSLVRPMCSAIHDIMLHKMLKTVHASRTNPAIRSKSDTIGQPIDPRTGVKQF